MEEIYQAIEEKIRNSGYPGVIPGEKIYDDICDQIDGKENGEYVLLSKHSENLLLEYHITIRDEDFNLGVLKITTPNGNYEMDFDE